MTIPATKISIDFNQINLPLSPNQNYRIELEQDFVRDADPNGNRAAIPGNANLFNFTSTDNPELTAFEPGAGQTSVVNNVFIELKGNVPNFSGALSAGLGNFRLYRVATPSDVLLDTVSVSDSRVVIEGNSVRINFLGFIDAENTYYLLADPGVVTDLYGFGSKAITDINAVRYTTSDSLDPNFPDLIALKISFADFTADVEKLKIVPADLFADFDINCVNEIVRFAKFNSFTSADVDSTPNYTIDNQANLDSESEVEISTNYLLGTLAADIEAVAAVITDFDIVPPKRTPAALQSNFTVNIVANFTTQGKSAAQAAFNKSSSPNRLRGIISSATSVASVAAQGELLDREILAVTHSSSQTSLKRVSVYYRTLNTYSPVPIDINTGLVSYKRMGFSPDGENLVVSGSQGSSWQLFERSGQPGSFSYNKLAQSSVPEGNTDAKWHPTEPIVVLVGGASTKLRIRRKVGNNLEFMNIFTTGGGIPDSTIHSVDWSPNGNSLAFITAGAPASVYVYDVTSIDTNSISLVRRALISISAEFGRFVEWAPDSNRLAVAHSNIDAPDPLDRHQFSIFQRSGNTFSKTTSWLGGTLQSQTISWHPNGVRLVATFSGQSNNPASGAARIYTDSGTLIQTVFSSSACWAARFNKTGSSLAVRHASEPWASVWNFQGGSYQPVAGAITIIPPTGTDTTAGVRNDVAWGVVKRN